MLNGTVAILLTVIVVVVVIFLVLFLYRSPPFGMRREGFFDSPYISVTHVKPEVVPLMLDADRGTTAGDSLAPLSDLASRNGLWIYEGNLDSQSGLCVGDAALLAYDSDQNKNKNTMMPQLVAPLIASASQRALFLLSPIDPAQRIPTLHEIVNNRSAQPTRVFCPTGVEASLFAIAWALAGGGDVSQHSDKVLLEVKNGWESAARAALAYQRNGEFAIVPVWACRGSFAQTTVISSWPKGAAASISYHPKDYAGEEFDGFLLESAPHMIKARSPVLTASPVPIVPGTRPSDLNALTQTVLVAPSLVLLYESDDPLSLSLTHPMADRVSDALLKGDPETLVLCMFYEAQGITLLPRTEETVRAFERRRMNASNLPDASRREARPAVMEQFGAEDEEGEEDNSMKTRVQHHRYGHLKRTAVWGRDPEDGPLDGPPVELVPTHAVRLAIEWKEEGGYAEATLEPSGTVSIDGVRLRAGDRVILENQDDFSDNGTWIVISAKGPHGIPVFQRPVALDPKGYVTKLERVRTLNSAKISWQWRFALPVKASERASVLKEGDRVAWLPLPGAPTGIVDAIGRATAVTKSNVSSVIEIVVPAEKVVASPEAAAFEDLWFDPKARCLDADAIFSTLDTRQQCKTVPGHTWDRPCTSDVECPFLQEGTETKRGRCLKSGRCEVPVGVRSTAYRSLNSVDDTMVCRCDSTGGSLSLNSASHECCGRPDAIQVFTMTEPFLSSPLRGLQ
jgi:hypothetical protein